MLLNNEWVNNEIKEEIKSYLETNENEHTTTQYPWDRATAVEVHSITSYLKKQKISQRNNLTQHLKELHLNELEEQ